MGWIPVILWAVLTVGLFGLILAIFFFFRYRKSRNKKDYGLMAVGIVLFAPSLAVGMIFFLVWFADNVDIFDWSQTDLNVGLILIIAAAAALGLCIWSFILHKKTGSKKGGLGMAIGLLILMWICLTGIPLCAGYGHSII